MEACRGTKRPLAEALKAPPDTRPTHRSPPWIFTRISTLNRLPGPGSLVSCEVARPLVSCFLPILTESQRFGGPEPFLDPPRTWDWYYIFFCRWANIPTICNELIPVRSFSREGWWDGWGWLGSWFLAFLKFVVHLPHQGCRWTVMIPIIWWVVGGVSIILCFGFDRGHGSNQF